MTVEIALAGYLGINVQRAKKYNRPTCYKVQIVIKDLVSERNIDDMSRVICKPLYLLLYRTSISVVSTACR